MKASFIERYSRKLKVRIKVDCKTIENNEHKMKLG